MNKTCSRCKESKPVCEFYKHKATKDGLRSCCKPCMLSVNRRWAEANPERAIAVRDAWAKANKDRRKRRAAELFIKNRERYSENARRWREANRDRHLENGRKWAERNIVRKTETNLRYKLRNAEKLRASIEAWREANPERAALCDQTRAARWRASRGKAAPKWRNEFFIKEIYALAKLRSKATGIKWHVDHIVPLQSKRVCGLHVENNLQLLTASENSRKRNRHWPDMP